ncbi:MAG: serine/threonine protein kinase, partial [Planctomycetales bacterium]|nr:serine/threonine protein kinase [Planctomycetales bacterium]
MTDKLSVDREALMGQVVTEFFERIARGESPRIDEYEERYPEIAEMLGRALPALKHINDSFGGQSTDPEFQLNASQRQLGDFLIVRQIGQGGMGIVYEAQQISLNRRVAIKVLPFASLLREQQLERFRIEARAAASLRHPNIVGVYAVGYERGVHFYAMEFIEGQSLAELMHELKNEMSNVHDDRNSASTDRALKEKPLEKTRPGSGADSTETDRAHKRSTLPDSRSREFYRTAAKLFAKAAQALQHAHELGIVHRDIKPANLLLDKDGKIWITDFGLAQVESDRSLTLSGDLLGTLRYMSPEQASGQNVLDARTDIYSLGVTLYEVLTGCPAFPARDRQSLIAQVIQAAAPPPSKLNQSIPRDLEAVVIKAMSQEPAERYATAGAMAADLQRFADGLPTLAKQPSMLKRGTHWMRRNPLPVAITLLVLLAIGLSSSVANVLLKRAVDRANEQTERAEKAEAELKVAADQSQQDADQARQAAETTAGINRFLTDYVFMRADPASSGSESGNSFRRMLDDATEYADRWFPESPALRSALYFTIGELYSRHGQFDQAVDLYRRSLGLMQRGVILGA